MRDLWRGRVPCDQRGCGALCWRVSCWSPGGSCLFGSLAWLVVFLRPSYLPPIYVRPSFKLGPILYLRISPLCLFLTLTIALDTSKLISCAFGLTQKSMISTRAAFILCSIPGGRGCERVMTWPDTKFDESTRPPMTCCKEGGKGDR